MLKKFIIKILAKKIRKEVGLVEEKEMTKEIPWWKSDSLWGGIIIGLTGTYEIARRILPTFGIDVDLPEISPHALEFLATLTGLIVVNGRLRAKSKIKKGLFVK